MKAFSLWASCPGEPSSENSEQSRPFTAACVAAAGATVLFGMSAPPILAASPFGLTNRPAALIHSLKVGRHANMVTLSLAGSGLLKAHVHPGRLTNSIDVDVTGKPLFVPASAHVGYGGVNEIHYGWLSASPPALRIIVTSGSRMSWRVEPHSNSLSVMLWKTGANDVIPAFHPAVHPAPGAHLTPAVRPIPAVRVSAPPSSALRPASMVHTAVVQTAAAMRAVTPASSVVTPPAAVRKIMAAQVMPTPSSVLRPRSSDHPTLMAQARPDGSVVATGGEEGAGLVTLNVKDASIEDVLKALADQSGTNIVAASGVTGNVTIKLKNVTVDQALRLITRLNKLSYQRDPNTNTIVVGTPDQLKAFGPANQAPIIVNLGRPDANDISAAVGKQFPDLKVSAGGPSAVMLSGPADMVAAAQRLIAQMEAGAAPEAGPPTVVPLQYASATDVAPVLAKLYPGLTIVAQGTHQMLFVGDQNDIASAQALVQKMDIVPSQTAAGAETVVYEARHADVNDLARILKQQMPDILVTVGPAPGFSPSSSSTTSLSTTSTGASPGGGQGGGSGGASGGSSGSSGSSGSGSSSGGYGSSGSGGSSSGSSSSGGLAMRTALLLLTGAPDRLAAAQAILEKVDVLPQQVELEVRVIDLDLEHMKTVGVNWSFAQGFVFGEQPPQSATGGTSGGSTGSAGQTMLQSIFPFAGGPLGRSFINASVDMLAQDQHNKVLANPKLVALSDRPANIFIGDEVHYVSNVSQATTGENVTTATENVGITLNMVTHVEPDGEITLNVAPNVSVLTSLVPTGAGAELPLISERSAQTTMRVHSGQTIAIGGLIRDEDLNASSKIPLLGDLPFFGALFRHRAITHERSEVVIFVRATVLPQAGAATEAAATAGSTSVPGT